MKEREKFPVVGCLVVIGSLGLAGYSTYEKMRIERLAHSEQIRNQDLGRGAGYRQAICDVERVELFRQEPRNEPEGIIEERIVERIQQVREEHC